MDIILHVGAHRCASTSFQHYLRTNTVALRARGTAVWGPLRLRRGMLHGLGNQPRTAAEGRAALRARGRVRMNLATAAQAGHSQLLVSEENLLGSIRANLRRHRLYRDAGERMARVAGAFGSVARVVLVVRPQDEYWASATGYGIARGLSAPTPDRLDRIVAQPRSWRDVVTDLACAVPEAEVLVLPFDRVAGRPDMLLRAASGEAVAPREGREAWRLPTPSTAALRAILRERGETTPMPAGNGRWTPFNDLQRAALRETWADDLFWLRAGADGLAHWLEEDTPRIRAVRAPGAEDRGYRHDKEGHMV